MNFKWIRIKGILVRVKIAMGNMRQETIFWVEGGKTFVTRTMDKM